MRRPRLASHKVARWRSSCSTIGLRCLILGSAFSSSSIPTIERPSLLLWFGCCNSYNILIFPLLFYWDTKNRKEKSNLDRYCYCLFEMFALRRTTMTAAQRYAAKAFGVSAPPAPILQRSMNVHQATPPRTMSTLTLEAPTAHSSMTPSSWLPSIPGWLQEGLYWISTLKRRRKMMNKHKLRKRRKKNRMKNK